MRVALDVTHAELTRTGVGRYPAELRPALEQVPGVELVTLGEPVADPGRRAARIARGLWREGTYYPLRLALRARRAGADLLHCPSVAPVASPGLPLVVTVHDLLPLSLPELFTAAVHAHTRLSLPFVRRAAHVLANSEWTRGEVIERLGLAPERVTATPFGLAERFGPGEADGERLRARFGIDGRYVLSVGTREPRKNLATLVRAYERLVAAGEEVTLVLAGGSGWLGAELDAALERAGGRVIVTGFVSDEELVELYRGAACFAFPSLGEGYGFPPLEAMACATPVVTTDRGALGEVTGGAAVIVEPRDDEALAGELGRVLSDAGHADELRRRGLERAAELTWASCAEQTVRAYADALSSTAS